MLIGGAVFNHPKAAHVLVYRKKKRESAALSIQRIHGSRLHYPKFR
jgi:hypothetical protein